MVCVAVTGYVMRKEGVDSFVSATKDTQGSTVPPTLTSARRNPVLMGEHVSMVLWGSHVPALRAGPVQFVEKQNSSYNDS